MAKRNSNYERKPREFYATPAWCTRALLPHIPARITEIWEPAAGDGAMGRVLADAGYAVTMTDIEPHAEMCRYDFLSANAVDVLEHAIITNPPFGVQGKLAEAFIRHALRIVERRQGFVAMLLRVDFDSASTRRDIFADHPAWSTKLIFTSRIVWFQTPGVTAGPSENHAWYLWDYQHEGSPQIAYHFEPKTPKSEGKPRICANHADRPDFCF
jgi:hypothetical protein